MLSFEEFTGALHKAGWRAVCDAQHTEVVSVYDEIVSESRKAQQIAELRQQVSKLTEQRTCNWQHDQEGYWAGDCGIAFCIEHETPELNDMHFCPKCGGKLEVKE